MGGAMHGVDAVGFRRRRASKQRTAGLRRYAAAIVLGLGTLVGCNAGGSDPEMMATSASASDPTGDLRSTPCQVVTREMVSRTFALPAAEIEQSSMSSLCAYRWEGNGKLLDVTVHVTAVGSDAAQSRALFESATSSLDSSAGVESSGRFRDAEGLGGAARIDTGNGDVHVLSDRLYFTLNAYYGSVMPEMSPVAVTAAEVRDQWRQDTLPQRQQAAARLARVVMHPDDAR